MNAGRLVRACLCVGALGVFAGCFAKQADLDNVRQEQRKMRAMVADNQVAIGSVRRGLDEVKLLVKEGGPRGHGASSGEVELRLAQLEARIARIEAGGQPGSLPGVETSHPGGSSPGTPAAALALSSEESVLATAPDDYRAATDLYRQGQWDAAVEKFREFIQKSPRSELADNAQYWIGECFYNQRDFNRAIIELNEVLLKYPQANRVPGALLALATAFSESGDPIDARLIIQKLISDHPESEEARIGRQKLKDLSR